MTREDEREAYGRFILSHSSTLSLSPNKITLFLNAKANWHSAEMFFFSFLCGGRTRFAVRAAVAAAPRCRRVKFSPSPRVLAGEGPERATQPQINGELIGGERVCVGGGASVCGERSAWTAGRDL